MTAPKPRLRDVEARAEAATEGPTLDRYDRGGGRSYVLAPERTLVADYFNESDREFYHASRTDVPALTAAIRAVLALHVDAGQSQGFTVGGYEYIDHCCGTCGSFGEYGEPWPCSTVRALSAHIDLDES